MYFFLSVFFSAASTNKKKLRQKMSQLPKRTIETFQAEQGKQATIGCPCAPGWDGEECAQDACPQKVCRTENGISSCIQPMTMDHILSQIPSYTVQGKVNMFVSPELSPQETLPKAMKPKETRRIENPLSAKDSLGRHHLFHTIPNNIKY